MKYFHFWGKNSQVVDISRIFTLNLGDSMQKFDGNTQIKNFIYTFCSFQVMFGKLKSNSVISFVSCLFFLFSFLSFVVAEYWQIIYFE